MTSGIRVAAAAAGALVLLGLAGCSNTPLQGQIVSKRYIPAHLVMVGRVPISKPECWQITLDTGAATCVSQSAWDGLPVGSYYDATKADQ